MLQKFLHFIKYNNAAIIILAVILILGGGALAAGPENIGRRETSIQGLDNTALLSADLNAFNMDFKIENLEQDEKYYYVTYSFMDLALADNVWQYQLSQRTQKVSQKIKQDIGEYMAKFLAKHYEARLRALKQARSEAEATGLEKRVEVTEYSGLLGRTLDLAAKVFPGYEPVIKQELPTPEFNPPTLPSNKAEAGVPTGRADNLTKLYNDYVAAHPEIFETPINPPTPLSEGGQNTASTTPDLTLPTDSVVPETPTATETPADSAGLTAGEAGSPPAIPEPASVQVIELPSSSAGEPAPEAVPAPAPDAAPQ